MDGETISLHHVEGVDSEGQKILQQLLSIGALPSRVDRGQFSEDDLKRCLQHLATVDRFYREMGGLVGYQKKIEELLRLPTQNLPSRIYHAPSFIDVTEPNAATKQAVEQGILSMPMMAEIYPLGGAADRLHLTDPKTGAELPAAKLTFAGKTLFERLLRDLQAREFFYYQRFGAQLCTPVAIMTSKEKDNHRHIEAMLEEYRWFGRKKDSFFLFTQPLVPVVDSQGRWVFSSPLTPLLKPGGHGALWKLAKDEGVFAWLKQKNVSKALVRQINNPLAAIDEGLVAFLGIGCHGNYKFGFASCPRLLKSAEGMNVLIEEKKEEGSTIVLTNVEYCDFAKCGIEDAPLRPGEPYSRFSSNTNILFADLASVEEAVEKCPFPGLLMNLKPGKVASQSIVMGRLESTMQNIADVFAEPKEDSLCTKHTFITYNKRHKTISTTKRAFVEGGSLQETPEMCFYDFLTAERELLEDYCHYQLPSIRSLQESLQIGPEFVFFYHPALGPFYSEIQKKVQRGRLHDGSFLSLEIADAEIQNLDLQGSLIIHADQVMGHEEEGLLKYSDQRGRCSLNNVQIVNAGVAWELSRPFWKGSFQHQEKVEIILHGTSEFVAENITLQGSHRFEVEDGYRLYISNASFIKTPLP